jgi:hypothetical protein
MSELLPPSAPSRRLSLVGSLKAGWLVLSVCPLLGACGGYSQADVDRQIEVAVDAALKEAESGRLEDLKSELESQQARVESTTTLPCDETVVVALSSHAAIAAAVSTVARDLLGRDLYAGELSVITSDVHEIERASAVTLCEVERGEVREYFEKDWRQELPELLSRRHRSEIDALARWRSSREMGCWNNSNSSPLLGCDE